MEMEQVIKLIETVSASELLKFEYEESGLKIRMEKPESGQAGEEAALRTEIQAVKEPTDSSSDKTVDCPLVGIFYRAKEEGGEPLVQVGDTVRKGQTLGIVEAMKLMNEIESEYDGVVTKILAEDGQAVEFGQPLFCIA